MRSSGSIMCLVSVCAVPRWFEGVFESENLQKSPCGRGAIWGGSKRKNSVGAPKWAIHVKTLLNDLFKLIKCTFYLLALRVAGSIYFSAFCKQRLLNGRVGFGASGPRH